MLENNLDLFSIEDAPAPRTALYHLPIRGVGTADQEALLDYLQRLAREHNVVPAALLRHIVLPQTAIRGKLYAFGFSQRYAKTINGYGKYATEFSSALSVLTRVDQLRFGTFLGWGSLFDPKGTGLFHAQRRWCPACLMTDQDSGRSPTFKLVWSCQCVTHCVLHQCRLIQLCTQCNSEQLHIDPRLAYGRCCACTSLLAESVSERTAISEREEFMYRAVAEMIASSEAAPALATQEALSDGIRWIRDQTSTTSVVRLIAKLKLTNGAVRKWVYREAKPQFDSLLEMCFRAGVTPIELLKQESATAPRLRSGEPPRRRVLCPLSPSRREELKEEVLRLLATETEWMHAKHLAASFGTTVGHFEYVLPDLFKQLTSHNTRIRKATTIANRARKADTARKVVRQLYSAKTHLTRREISKALSDSGLSMRCSDTRSAALEERALIERAMSLKSSLMSGPMNT